MIELIYPYFTIAMALMGMFYLTAKAFEFFVGLLANFAWFKWSFKWSKNKQDNALKAMSCAFDVSPENMGKAKAYNLSNGYVLMFISKDHVDSILKKADELGEVCGTSSTTAQSSDSLPTQE